MENWENVNLTVESQPYTPDQADEETEPKPKFKWSWRINQLALPKKDFMRYLPMPKLGLGKIDPECEWRTMQLACPPLLRLIFNKRKIQDIVNNPRLVKNVMKVTEDTKNSIYYYYYKKLKDIKAKKLAARLKRKKLKQQKKKPQLPPAEVLRLREERLEKLATPKRTIEPEELPRIFRKLDELWSGVLRLSQPRTYIELPPKDWGVSQQALKYKITAIIEQLCQLPEHRQYVPPPPPPPPKKRIKVKDMKIVLSERLQRISQPRPRARKRDDDLKENPWGISPTALKYKATPRILELAKPLERD